MRWLLAATVSLVLLSGVCTHAAQMERRAVEVVPHPHGGGDVAALVWEDVQIPTRKGLRQRLLIARPANAGRKAVILFKGGLGTPITKKAGGNFSLNDNFLVRSAPLFARAGFVAAVADAPSDRSDGMDDRFRSSKAHRADIARAVDFLVSEGVCEVFLVGTSRGTQSVGYLATVMTHANIRGYVLTASLEDVVFYADKIERPVLMVHHSDDACRVTTYPAAVAS